jgi:predicted nucleic acid-binding Zn ribbon protein
MQSLNALMQQLERSPEWQSTALLRRILALWPQLVGEAVAQHSQPTKMQHHRLEVTVSSSAWSQTLTFERPRILQKLRDRLPETRELIHDLRFTTVRWRQSQQKLTPPPQGVLAAHPSWVSGASGHRATRPHTAAEAFASWATWRQAQWAQQSTCPACQHPCPTQELQRWSMCSICVAQHWQQSLSQNRMQ